MQEGGQEGASVQAIYSLQTHVTGLVPASAMGPDHTPKNRNADDSGIRCATSYGLQGPKSSGKRGQSPCLVSQGFSRWGVTNRS